MFKRKIESYLETYLNSDEERILCVDGARQVENRSLFELWQKSIIQIM